MNVNPTNLVRKSIAERFWRGANSGLREWDLITPNRASSNIGEFAILLPGEEQVVLTKEMFVLRVTKNDLWDPFYLLWALCLRAVRNQWHRIALMQTNREDCGNRYREIVLPIPDSAKRAKELSEPFRNYFTVLARSKARFLEDVASDEFEYIANVMSAIAHDDNNDKSSDQDLADEY